MSDIAEPLFAPTPGVLTGAVALAVAMYGSENVASNARKVYRLAERHPEAFYRNETGQLCSTVAKLLAWKEAQLERPYEPRRVPKRSRKAAAVLPPERVANPQRGRPRKSGSGEEARA